MGAAGRAEASIVTASTGPVTLVTGGAGFVGSHLLDAMRSEGSRIVAWRRPGTSGHDSPGVEWSEVELLDREAIRGAVARLRPAAIYHLAGSAHVADSWAHPRETFEGNALATHYLLQALDAEGLKPRVLITGSATVYKPSSDPITEDSAIGPVSPYATSKLAQEMIGVRAWEEHGIPVLPVRAFNHVGPRQTPAYVAPSIARQVALIEAGRMDPVLKMGNLDPQRDVMDVRDTVRAYTAIMATGTPGTPYNVCSGRPVRIGDLVDRFRSRARVPITIEQDPARMRPSDVPILYGSHARLTRDTGWSPQISLEETVDALLDWWRAEIN
jgi:GDP-4-dehydro-6-deoxy-D-mannose reductase